MLTHPTHPQIVELFRHCMVVWYGRDPNGESLLDYMRAVIGWFPEQSRRFMDLCKPL